MEAVANGFGQSSISHRWRPRFNFSPHSPKSRRPHSPEPRWPTWQRPTPQGAGKQTRLCWMLWPLSPSHPIKRRSARPSRTSTSLGCVTRPNCFSSVRMRLRFQAEKSRDSTQYRLELASCSPMDCGTTWAKSFWRCWPVALVRFNQVTSSSHCHRSRQPQSPLSHRSRIKSKGLWLAKSFVRVSLKTAKT